MKLMIHKQSQIRPYCSLLSFENFAIHSWRFSYCNLSWKSSGLSVGWEDSVDHSYFKLTGQEHKNAQRGNCIYGQVLNSWKADILLQTAVEDVIDKISQLKGNNLKMHDLLVCSKKECVFTWMGEYHFWFWGAFLLWAFLGLGSKGSYSCSGIFTTAFFGFSSFAPSSVEPFPPQRTYTE